MSNNKGMTNSELFGEVICTVEPKELIPRGYIVGPAIHLMHVTTETIGEGVDTTEVIAEAYKRQKEDLSKYRIPYIQMLVSSRGYKDHQKIEDELLKLWELVGEQVDVYVVEADSARKNGGELNDRITVLEEIKHSEKPAIVIHYDTLAEGIDISTLTGVCVLRRLSQFKLLQTIGRAGRPHKLDIDDNGEVLDMNHRVKPYSIVTLPIVNGQHIGGDDAAHIARTFISGGYDLLSTPFIRTEDKPKPAESDDDDKFNFGEDEIKKAFDDQIKDVETEREYEKLLELGLIF